MFRAWMKNCEGIGRRAHGLPTCCSYCVQIVQMDNFVVVTSYQNIAFVLVAAHLNRSVTMVQRQRRQGRRLLTTKKHTENEHLQQNKSQL